MSDGLNVPQRYICGCERTIEPEYVEGVLPGGLMAGRMTVLVAYRCPCLRNGAAMTRRFFRFPSAIDYLVGDESVPYRNPVPLRPVDEEHPDLKAWRNLIEWYGQDSDEFVRAFNKP